MIRETKKIVNFIKQFSENSIHEKVCVNQYIIEYLEFMPRFQQIA
jgi:hypothetical protein